MGHDAYELQVRLYAADNGAYQLLPASAFAEGIEASIVAHGGYDSATITLLGTPADYPNLLRKRRVQLRALWRRENDPETTRRDVLLWSGQVAKIRARQEDNVPRLEVKCAGFWRQAGKGRCNKKYVGGQSGDRASIANDLLQRFVLPRFPGAVALCLPVSDNQAGIDSRDRLVEEVVEALATDTVPILYGGDIHTSALDGLDYDRVYFVPASGVTHTIDTDSVRAGTRQREEDASKQVSALRIIGGQLVLPNRLGVAMGNASFEEPSDDLADAPNNLSDPSFENRDTGVWTLGGGASFKSANLSEGPTHHGDDMVELDGLGEYVQQKREPAAGAALSIGRTLTFAFWARQENVSGADSEITATFRCEDSGSGTVGTNTTLTVTPPQGYWQLYELDRVFETGSEKFDVKVALTDAGAHGVMVDDCRVYDKQAISQPGWEFVAEGDAQYTFQSLAYDAVEPYHGAYCLRLAWSGVDNPEHRILVRPKTSPQVKVEVAGGETVYMRGYWRGVDASTDIPACTYRIYWFNADGGTLGTIWNAQDFPTISSSLTSWQPRSFDATAPEGCAYATIEVEMDEDGECLLDALSVAAGEESDPYYPADRFEWDFEVNRLYLSGEPVFEEAQQIPLLWDVIENETILSYAEAEALARATFDLRTLPVPRPEIEVFGVFETGNLLTTGEVRPGDTLRAIGGSAADLLPDPLLVWEVGLRYREGVISFTFNAQDERKDAVRRIRDLVKKVASRVVRGGTGQALFSTGAGGGGGGTGGGSADFGSLAPTSTKGDLIVHDGAENVRLPVGANGQTPMPDSSLSAGIGYVTAVGSRWAAVVRQDFLFGKGDFYSTTSGAGASADLSDNYGDTGGHPGCLVLTPGTTTSGNAFIGTFGAYNGCVKLGYGEWIIEECVYLTHLSDGTDRFTVRVGMGDKTSGNPTDGVFFRYTDNANSGKWECVTRNNDTETASDSGITVAATTWYRLSIHINAAASSVAFYIDGALVATNTTNIPTTGRNTSFMNSMGKSAGTNARYALLDYVNVDCLLSTPR